MAVPASKFWRGNGWERKIVRGQKCEICAQSMQKCANLYAEIVQFGLILTHMKLYGGKLEGARKYLGRQIPLCPPVASPLYKMF